LPVLRANSEGSMDYNREIAVYCAISP